MPITNRVAQAAVLHDGESLGWVGVRGGPRLTGQASVADSVLSMEHDHVQPHESDAHRRRHIISHPHGVYIAVPSNRCALCCRPTLPVECC